MRKLAFLLGMILCLCLTASAQDRGRGDLSIGYSYIRAYPATATAPTFSLNGGSVSASWNVGWIGIVGDIGGYHVSHLGPVNVDANLVTLLGGGRFTLHRTERARLFAQVLGGVAHSNAASFQQAGVTAKTSLAVAAGAGLDWFLTPHLGIRGQADYLATRFQEIAGTPSTQNNIRITAAFVLRF